MFPIVRLMHTHTPLISLYILIVKIRERISSTHGSISGTAGSGATPLIKSRFFSLQDFSFTKDVEDETLSDFEGGNKQKIEFGCVWRVRIYSSCLRLSDSFSQVGSHRHRLGEDREWGGDRGPGGVVRGKVCWGWVARMRGENSKVWNGIMGQRGRLPGWWDKIRYLKLLCNNTEVLYCT